LQNGLYLDQISLPNFKVHKLYIKWNESLDISIKEIKISQNNSKEGLNIETISKEIRNITNYYQIFEKVIIDNIHYEEFNASFKYIRGENGYISIRSPKVTLYGSLEFIDENLHVNLDYLKDLKRDIVATGKIIINPHDKTLQNDVTINIHNEINLQLLSFINENQLYYQVNSNQEIKKIQHTMKLLDLDSDINYWAYEAIDFSSISLSSAYGRVDFDDLDNAYKNIFIEARAKDLKYKYNTKIDPINSAYTDLKFDKGVLYIYPKKATTYKSKLGKSWLKIDFTKANELLTLKLLFDGKLDKETLGILKTYKIAIPFLQKTGLTKVDLTLAVTLRDITVDAQGKFFVKSGKFDYKDQEINIRDLYLKLNNYKVSISNMKASYKNNISTDVDVEYDAKTSKGILKFDLQKISFKDFYTSLDQKNLKASYAITPNGDTLRISKSKWKIYDQIVKIESLELPIDLDSLLIKIPNTALTINNSATLSSYGTLNLKNLNYNISAKILDLDMYGIKLLSQPTFKIKFEDKFTLSSNKRINFAVHSLESFINQIKLTKEKDTFYLAQTYINIGEIVKTKLSGSYSLKSNEGEIKTNRLRIKTQALGDLYLEAYDTNLKVKKLDKDFQIYSKDLEANFLYNDTVWKLDLNSASRLARNSKLLSTYKVVDGDATIYKKHSEPVVHIKSNFFSRHKLMVLNNTPLDKYFINGRIKTNSDTIHLNINENVNIDIHDNVTINMHDMGVNLNTLVEIINEKKGDINNYSEGNIHLNAENVYLYISKDRHVISDTINLKYLDKSLQAKLTHKKGTANIDFKNGYFHTEGNGFNDQFMENLFALSKFKNGSFNFKMSGTPSKYDGLFTVEKTTLLDYKVLNNVLAFVNTVPALVTFSVPDYNSKGLYIQNAYMKFNALDNIFTITDVNLDSKELDIVGKGITSFTENFIDMELNLKSALGDKFSKIPLVGYILLNKDSLSTTLKISGALDNPEVTSLLAKDIAVAPLNILLRTITLPYYLLTGKDANSTSE